MFEATVRGGVCRLGRPGTRWLSTGFDGGERRAPAAYNVTVPDGFDRTDLASYAAERRRAAGFDDAGPTLLTGVAQRHARRARRGPVEAVATVGLSNPAALPVPDADGADGRSERRTDDCAGDRSERGTDGDAPDDRHSDDAPHAGTVNLVVGTERALAPGALETLLTVVAEAKAATLLARVGVPGTTSDAAVVACDPAGEERAFAGPATEVGAAARVCVRDAVLAALGARYADENPPESVDGADHGVAADGRASVSTLDGRAPY